MLAEADLFTFFVEPHCVLADRLRKRYADGITVAPELRDLREEDVGPASVCPSGELDPRLMAALNTLRDTSVSMPIRPRRSGSHPSACAAWRGTSSRRPRLKHKLREAAQKPVTGRTGDGPPTCIHPWWTIPGRIRTTFQQLRGRS
jgi:hypothetical protein